MPTLQPRLTVHDYQAAVRDAQAAAILLAQHNIPALLDAIALADITEQLPNPTLWLQKHRAMEQDRQLLAAALPLYRLVQGR